MADEESTFTHPDDWTPLQEAYIHKLMATYQANLYFLNERFPDVFKKLMEVNFAPPFNIEKDGKVTVYSGRFKGKPYEFVELGQMLYSIFDNEKSRPHVHVTTEYVDDPLLAAPHHNNPDFYRHVEPKYRFELINKFRDMTPNPEDRLTVSDFGKRKLPIAMVFGTGYGWHLDRLVDDWEIRHLILVDTDLARLNLSLYFVDYISLHQRFFAKGFYFTILYDDNIEKLSDHLRLLLYHFWPPYFIQGAGLFFNDYDSQKVRDLWGNLKRDLWTFYRGWGFLDDEIIGLKQAVENSLDRHPLYTRKPNIPEDAVAFVIGSGPSFDHLMPLLRKYKDRAVIFSCGSAISALARNNIKPDFHIEIERTYLTYAFLEEPGTRDFVRDIPLIVLSIIHPEVFKATERGYMFLKELDLGSAIADFSGKIQRFRSGPTCTNGGLDIPLRMGFKRCYLIGVDYGFHDSNYHHSTSSVYYDEEVELAEQLDKIVDITHESHKDVKKVPGNFCDEVLSTEAFIHSRDSMVLSIRDHPQQNVYNLNDGAHIIGSIPLKPDELEIEPAQTPKEKVIETMLGAFTEDYDTNPFRNIDLLCEQIGAVRNDLERIFKQERTNKMQICDTLYDMHHYLFDERHKETHVFPLVRGSLLHMGRFFFDCVTLFRDEKMALEYAEFGFDLILRFLDAGRETVHSLHQVGQEWLVKRANEAEQSMEKVTS